MARVKVATSGCWIWMGCRQRNGYGRLTADGVSGYAHRHAHALFIGPIPHGMFVLHACDNPPCVNPAHLRAASNAENVRDRSLRARQARGATIGLAKLSEAQVREIRALLAAGGMSQRAIAARFGVSQYQVYAIKYRRTWAHVTEVAA